MVRYQFARDLEGQIIHIQNLERGSVKKSTYKCLSCGNELIAKIGHIKERHFAHKAQHACSGETYLHQLGKKLFETEYLHCLSAGLPFSIEYVEEKLCNYKESKFKVCCDLGNEKKQFDLTKYFNQILVEHNFDEFRPDIMLLSSKTQEKIFIEIAVTHLSTAKKLESNIRLIEIKVEDEKDLGSISTHHIKPSWNVTFNNFKSHIIKQQHCQGKCQVDFDIFIVNHNDKALLVKWSLDKLELNLKNSRVKYFRITRLTEGYEGIKYRYHLAKARKEGVGVRNCFLCKYHGENFKETFREQPIFCKFLKHSCNSNEAATCNAFSADPSYVESAITEWMDFIKMGYFEETDI